MREQSISLSSYELNFFVLKIKRGNRGLLISCCQDLMRRTHSTLAEFYGEFSSSLAISLGYVNTWSYARKYKILNVQWITRPYICFCIDWIWFQLLSKKSSSRSKSSLSKRSVLLIYAVPFSWLSKDGSTKKKKLLQWITP